MCSPYKTIVTVMMQKPCRLGWIRKHFYLYIYDTKVVKWSSFMCDLHQFTYMLMNLLMLLWACGIV